MHANEIIIRENMSRTGEKGEAEQNNNRTAENMVPEKSRQ
jgi:hypothetical protein